MFLYPDSLAVLSAATTPPEGPEKTASTPRSREKPTSITPPFDCMISRESSKPSCLSLACNRSRYCCSLGLVYALTSVVLSRSNSRICGSTSHESVTKQSGCTSRTISATRRSCAGFA